MSSLETALLLLLAGQLAFNCVVAYVMVSKIKRDMDAHTGILGLVLDAIL